jgi:hypothetical protein
MVKKTYTPLIISCLARLIWSVLVLAALPDDVRAGDPVLVPSGGSRVTTAADLAPHPATSSAFNERWSYHILLEGNVQVLVNLSMARLGGFREPTVGADLALLGFGGQEYRVAREYPVSTHFRFDRGASRLEVHPRIFFEGAPPRRHRLYFETRKGGVHYQVDLTFTDMAEGVTWGDGEFRLGSETLRLYIHIPHARVSGTISVNGERRDVRGTAYMDHTSQTAYAPRLLRAAFRMVRHSGSGWEVGHYFLPDGRYEDRPVGFGVRRAGGQTALLRPEVVEVVNSRRSLGIEVPGQIRFAFTDGTQTILTRRNDRQAFAVLEELSALERAVVRRFIGGEAVYFRGNGMLGSGQSAAYDFLLVR